MSKVVVAHLPGWDYCRKLEFRFCQNVTGEEFIAAVEADNSATSTPHCGVHWTHPVINRATQKNPPLIVDYLGPGAVDAAVNNDREQMRSDITTSRAVWDHVRILAPDAFVGEDRGGEDALYS